MKRQKLGATFKKVDRDGDGSINGDEVREALMEHGLSDMEVESVMAKVGPGEVVDFNKFSELITPYWDNAVPDRANVEAVFKSVSHCWLYGQVYHILKITCFAL